MKESHNGCSYQPRITCATETSQLLGDMVDKKTLQERIEEVGGEDLNMDTAEDDNHNSGG